MADQAEGITIDIGGHNAKSSLLSRHQKRSHTIMNLTKSKNTTAHQRSQWQEHKPAMSRKSTSHGKLPLNRMLSVPSAATTSLISVCEDRPGFNGSLNSLAPPRPTRRQTSWRSDISVAVDPELSRFGSGFITLLVVLLVFVCMPLSLPYCIHVAKEYERAVVFRLGRLRNGRLCGPGLFFTLPCIERHTKVDLRIVSFVVPPQEILSKDSVTVSVDAVCFYRVSNPTKAVCHVGDYRRATHLLVAVHLRNVLGTQTLSEIMSDREKTLKALIEELDKMTAPWGVTVERLEIRDVRLPLQLQRAMAAEAETAREAQAKILAAKGEAAAASSLFHAGRVLEETPQALSLRYLQTLGAICNHDSTILFPFPVDLPISQLT